VIPDVPDAGVHRVEGLAENNRSTEEVTLRKTDSGRYQKSRVRIHWVRLKYTGAGSKKGNSSARRRIETRGDRYRHDTRCVVWPFLPAFKLRRLSAEMAEGRALRGFYWKKSSSQLMAPAFIVSKDLPALAECLAATNYSNGVCPIMYYPVRYVELGPPHRSNSQSDTA
jgi:hypothetical protein